jgi:hypothetical protein
MREEMEHASMLLTYLFTEGSILQEEKAQPPRASAGEGRKTYEEARRQASRSAR